MLLAQKRYFVSGGKELSFATLKAKISTILSNEMLLEEICSILIECGPSTVPQLYFELKRRGLQPHGQTPINTVSATVSERCGRKPGHPQTFVRRKNGDGHFVYFTPLQARLSRNLPEYSGSEMGTWGVMQRTGRKTSPSKTPGRKYS